MRKISLSILRGWLACIWCVLDGRRNPQPLEVCSCLLATPKGFSKNRGGEAMNRAYRAKLPIWRGIN